MALLVGASGTARLGRGYRRGTMPAGGRRRRRRAVAGGVALLVVATVALALAGLAGASRDLAVGEVVTVAPGDTLWRIAAARVQPGEDIRVLVHQIRRANALSDSTLHPGQELVIVR